MLENLVTRVQKEEKEKSCQKRKHTHTHKQQARSATTTHVILDLPRRRVINVSLIRCQDVTGNNESDEELEN
jgi:hypothetical protein